MARDLHTIAVLNGSVLAQEDRLVLLTLPQQATPAGGGAGQSVTLPFTGLSLPAVYSVQVTPSQDATVWITGRSQSGFTVNLAPRLAANTLAVGTVDVVVLA